jgi:hypothetical protein
MKYQMYPTVNGVKIEGMKMKTLMTLDSLGFNSNKRANTNAIKLLATANKTANVTVTFRLFQNRGSLKIL